MRKNIVPSQIKRGFILVLTMLVAFLSYACSSELDKKRFDSLNRRADSVQDAIASGATYERFGELLKGFSDEIEAVGNAQGSKREKELLMEYSALLKMYQDGYLLWRFSREFSKHNLVPQGRIYVGQDVEPIVAKYQLSTERHMFGPTGQSWKSISAGSIKIIWYNAGEQRKHIDYLLSE